MYKRQGRDYIIIGQTRKKNKTLMGDSTISKIESTECGDNFLQTSSHLLLYAHGITPMRTNYKGRIIFAPNPFQIKCGNFIIYIFIFSGYPKIKKRKKTKL